jgi:hypothetical protein
VEVLEESIPELAFFVVTLNSKVKLAAAEASHAAAECPKPCQLARKSAVAALQIVKSSKGRAEFITWLYILTFLELCLTPVDFQQ